jgi:hypothetical protein
MTPVSRTIPRSLDNTPSNASGVGCQGDARVVPDGWRLAEDTPQLRIALMGGKEVFGTNCLITANGRSFLPRDNSDCGGNTYIAYDIKGDVCPAEPWAPMHGIYWWC